MKLSKKQKADFRFIVADFIVKCSSVTLLELGKMIEEELAKRVPDPNK